jgi:GABA(A) receptor-associated protein
MQLAAGEESRSLAPGEAQRILAKYPDRIPVVVARARGSRSSLPELRRWKFLVPRDLTVGQFMYILRGHMTLSPEKALFLFIGNSLPLSTMRMVEAWKLHCAPDGALHVVCSAESTFGGQ